MDYTALSKEELIIEINKLENRCVNLEFELSKSMDILSNINTPVVVYDDKSTVISANSAALSLFSLTKEEVLGKMVHEIKLYLSELEITVDSREFPVKMAIDNKKPINNVTMEIFNKKLNKKCRFILNAFPIFDDKDDVKQVIVTYNDAMVSKNVISELMAKNKILEDMARKDGLTELLNHNRIFFELNEQIERTAKNSRPLSIIMLDLDHFKEINDEHGHVFGDKILALVANTIRTSIRETDFAGRYGGEEFLVILPNTDLEEAIVIADRIRENVSKIKIKDALVTISGGIKEYNKEDMFEFVGKADELLYIAKNAGRNRIEK